MHRVQSIPANIRPSYKTACTFASLAYYVRALKARGYRTPAPDPFSTTPRNHRFCQCKMKTLVKKTIILAVNAGSSSVKISVYSAEQGQSPIRIAEAQVNGLTAPPASLKYQRGDRTIFENREVDGKVGSQRDAFSLILDTLIGDHDMPDIQNKDDIGIICHRIVHGGDYTKPQLISDGTYHHLEDLNDLAPLHNANSLGIVQLCIQALPKARNVACFDSQFHATIPEHIRTYPIDQEVARNNRLRKYGFHGISYSFITRATAEFLGKPRDDVHIIALHLGSGASACAIRGGKSWDTSMGLTPLAGLPGATRSGSVDPRQVVCPFSLFPVLHRPLSFT